jgi:hypothetical protein
MRRSIIGGFRAAAQLSFGDRLRLELGTAAMKRWPGAPLSNKQSIAMSEAGSSAASTKQGWRYQ